MASETFAYEVLDGTTTDTIDVVVTTPATNDTGFGPSYAVTAITGAIGPDNITGEVGSGNTLGTGASGNTYDNAVFVSPTDGAGSGNVAGIDNYGLEFTTASTEYNLYTSGSSLELYNVTTGTTDTPVLVATTAPCYCPGTLIRTADGEQPVEALTIGETVVTASGEHRPIKWIGRRAYEGRFLAANPNVQPIRFHAGSLGSGLPRRDLLVSPEHAMFLDGLLVPARLLVNGSTITQERGLHRVDYVHVELDSHDVLLAEGAPSESFLDDASRGLFHNASEFAALYPDRSAPGEFCAPKVDEGYQLEAIRRRLAAVTVQIAQAA